MDEQPLKRPRSGRVYDGPDNDYGDDDDEDEQAPAGYGEGDFIMLDGGKVFIRKFEIVSLRWEYFLASDPGEEQESLWRLRVYFSDCPNMVVYGDEASDLMKSFGLPVDPPQR